MPRGSFKGEGPNKVDLSKLGWTCYEGGKGKDNGGDEDGKAALSDGGERGDSVTEEGGLRGIKKLGVNPERTKREIILARIKAVADEYGVECLVNEERGFDLISDDIEKLPPEKREIFERALQRLMKQLEGSEPLRY